VQTQQYKHGTRQNMNRKSALRHLCCTFVSSNDEEQWSQFLTWASLACRASAPSHVLLLRGTATLRCDSPRPVVFTLLFTSKYASLWRISGSPRYLLASHVHQLPCSQQLTMQMRASCASGGSAALCCKHCLEHTTRKEHIYEGRIPCSALEHTSRCTAASATQCSTQVELAHKLCKPLLSSATGMP
jgi:hypothetical protein